MNRNRWIRAFGGIALGVLAVGVAAIGVSYAQSPNQAEGQRAMRGRATVAARPLAAMRRGLAQLGLSNEQKQQITSIVKARAAEIKDVRQEMRKARRGVASAIANDEGEAAIRARSAELAKVQADAAVFRAELRKQVFGVLTPEQQAKAKELRLKAVKRSQSGPSPSSRPTR